MSSNFTGVTFAKQKVAPSDDAIIRRAALSDGILTGCALSYSGSTLTMAAGQLLVCGRQIRHPSSQNWAVVDATSGYARVVLTIDLTRTASKDVFDQVLDTIEYASSADGFAALEQADVNASGVRYQVVLAVVSLGTGGITGIVSQLQKSEGSGGGANLFAVISVTYPAGSVCTCTQGTKSYKAKNTSGLALFAVLETGDWTVSCTNGVRTASATVTISAQGQAKHVELQYILYLFWEGEGAKVELYTAKEQNASISISNESVIFSTSQPGLAYSQMILRNAEAIDISQRSTLCFDLDCSNAQPSLAAGGALVCSSNAWEIGASTFAASYKIQKNETRHTVSLDISALTGSYYMGVTGAWVGHVYNIYLP